MKSALVMMLGISLLGLTAGVAHADPSSGSTSSSSSSSGSSSNLEIKIGIFEPNGNGLNTHLPVNQSNFIGTANQFTAGLEYEYFPASSPNGLGSAYSFSLDYVQVQRLFFTPVAPQPLFAFSTIQTTFPALVNYKYYWQAAPNAKGYVGFGVGEFLGDYTGFAYSAFIGINPGQNLDLELRYIGDGGGNNINGSSLSGVFGLDLGWHFR